MRTRWLLVILALAGAAASGAAFAHANWHFGVYAGPGLWYYPPPYYYQPYPYYYPPAPAAPPVYIERNAPPPQTENWWNYCPESKTYYPYVNECPGGWQRVSPVPPDLKERDR